MNTKQTFLLALALLVSIVAFSQVSVSVDNTVRPDESAMLTLESTTKGFLPPRLTNGERDAITSPASGLTIFNTTENCLQWYNGIGWYDGCDGSTFVAPVTGIPDNAACATATISVTPCSVVSGATLNDDATTTDGTEYDWTDATSYMGGTTTAALVEIGGQCWFGRNTNTPSSYTGTQDWNGYWEDGATEPAVGEGRLYQWNAAMNGSTTERAQGVCPTGWHVPSDCEWMYLENTLGMSTTDQENTGWRGTQGRKLSTLVLAPATNSSGFTALLAGGRVTSDGTFGDRGTFGRWWSSSETSTTQVRRRRLTSSQAGVDRDSFFKELGFSVRCLKD